MSVPDNTLWKLQDQTKAKHQILKAYLVTWIPILSTNNDRIVYLDGFSGPGQYKQGEPGSPIIALQTSLEHTEYINEMTFIFIEEREDRLEHLRGLIHDMLLPEKFNVNLVHGQYETNIEQVLNQLERDNLNLAPTFAFIDPFGFEGVPMDLNHRILSHSKTEVFVNFSINSVNRFIEHQNQNIRNEIQRLIGVDLNTIDLESSPRFPIIRDAYREGLEQAAAHVRSFEMYDEEHRPIYDLYFAGNHRLGHRKMKIAMWDVDPTGGFQFSDATDPDQLVLFSDDPEPQLLPQILDQFTGRSEVIVREIKNWTVEETPFLVKHMKGALRQGEEDGAFYVYAEKVSGETRRRGTFPEDAIIDFTHQVGSQESLAF